MRQFQKETTLEKVEYRWAANGFLIFFALYLENVIGESRGFDATAVLFKVESELFFRCHQCALFFVIFVGVPWAVRTILPLSKRDKESAPEEVEESEDKFTKWGMLISILLFVTYLLMPMAVLDWASEAWAWLVPN